MVSGEENISSEGSESGGKGSIRFQQPPSILGTNQLLTPFKRNCNSEKYKEHEASETLNKIDSSYSIKEEFDLNEESVWNEYEGTEDFPEEKYRPLNAHWVKAKNIEPKSYQVSVFADNISHESVM
eukprot:TRINITY_DN26240_c0_g1_i2.p1 TRINITY_DN26240_c0_g1~~TRINITY_DN26240_c0_g1_i2.p1  ORF type:complete len:126 (-),score=46.43 TRINITY_DN26240_c0_g1_i2:230-607(-)